MTREPNPVEPPDSTARVFDRITDGVFALDDEFQFTYLNDQAEDPLAADTDEVLGRQIWDAYPAATETELYDAVHDALETQEPVETELYLDSLDIWISARIYPSESGLSVYCHDIPEQREHKRKLDFRTALLEAQTETTIDGQLVVDQDRNILYYNQRFAEIWGIPDEILSEWSDERALEYVLDLLADPD
ncbi:PAS domain-containing protein [Natrinema sp. SYSU A 869]|uniref:PAS domain-containing protein n=1 Tax=Natrinema sp. SYSU A 869 TaxID=2871694 RepID=UPI001CA3EC09|nr:PAS domain-containing protein [Natrinema sp. SYSU A 869]